MTTSHNVLAALDVGGSSVKYGVVDLGRCHSAGVGSIPVRADGPIDIVSEDLGDAATSVLAHPECSGPSLAVAFPGPFDYVTGRSEIRGQRKFDAIFGLPLDVIFRERSGCPDLDVRFCNDADAAAWGEARCGAGRTIDRFLMITLGTGFGGSLVDKATAVGPSTEENVAGRLYERSVGDHGRADDVLSGYGLANLVGVEPTELPIQAERVRSGGDRQPFQEFGRRLGQLLTEVAAEFDLSTVIIGGGVASVFDLFEGSLRDTFSGQTRQAALGQKAALFGAAALFG